MAVVMAVTMSMAMSLAMSLAFLPTVRVVPCSHARYRCLGGCFFACVMSCPCLPVSSVCLFLATMPKLFISGDDCNNCVPVCVVDAAIFLSMTWAMVMTIAFAMPIDFYPCSSPCPCLIVGDNADTVVAICL